SHAWLHVEPIRNLHPQRLITLHEVVDPDGAELRGDLGVRELAGEAADEPLLSIRRPRPVPLPGLLEVVLLVYRRLLPPPHHGARRDGRRRRVAE
ncbi:Os02g0115801, partial [Oryza sativa Japonica Group]